MGVPQYFSWLIQNYPDTLLQTEYHYGCPQHLLLDFNGAIHPATRKPELTTFEAIFKSIINYLNDLISKVNPSKSVFIAIDGVAPLAKMRQQRFRRYKSIFMEEQHAKIKRRYKDYQKQPFDYNMISPGTDFMNQLNDHLIKYIANEAKVDHPGLEFRFSGSDQPGEGEHKIMSLLRSGQIDHDDGVIIYGMDSDLIFLSLLHHRPKMALFRENNRNRENQFEYLNMDNMIDTIKTVMNNDSHSGIIDYVALSIILGNDFLPTFPSITIKNDGFNKLLKIYKEIKAKHNLESLVVIDDDFELPYNFDSIFLYHLISRIDQEETKNLQINRKINLKKMNNQRMFSKPKTYERDIELLEKLKQDDLDVIRVDRDGYQTRYYQYYLATTNVIDDDVNVMVKDYLKGMIWMINYYCNGCQNWSWQYHYLGAPLASSFHRMISDHINCKTILDGIRSELIEEIDQPFHVYEQLMIILPPQSKDLLPVKISKLMVKLDSPLICQYPQKFAIDYQFHGKLWECYPILPPIDLKMTRKVVQMMIQKEKEIKKYRDEWENPKKINIKMKKTTIH